MKSTGKIIKDEVLMEGDEVEFVFLEGEAEITGGGVIEYFSHICAFLIVSNISESERCFFIADPDSGHHIDHEYGEIKKIIRREK